VLLPALEPAQSARRRRGVVCACANCALWLCACTPCLLPRERLISYALLAEQDLGKNFFVTQQSLGEPRCQVVTSLLRELNDEVKGVGLDEDPVELIEKSPEFFAKFSCVVATDLPEQVHILKSPLHTALT
jgi:hypothetical protein